MAKDEENNFNSEDQVCLVDHLDYHFTLISSILVSNVIISSFLTIIFAILSNETRVFESTLIEQNYTMNYEGYYVVYQKFTFEPIKLMTCSTHERVQQTQKLLEIGEIYSLYLDYECKESFYISSMSFIIVLTVSTISYIAIVLYLLKYNLLKYHPKTVTTQVIIFMISIHICYFVTSLDAYLDQVRYVYGFRAKTKVISQEIYVNHLFDYCHRINANVSSVFNSCYNVSYTGDCFHTYEEALTHSTRNEVYDLMCNISYDAKVPPYDIANLSLSIIFPSLYIIMLIIKSYRNS